MKTKSRIRLRGVHTGVELADIKHQSFAFNQIWQRGGSNTNRTKKYQGRSTLLNEEG